jgi:O-6-methylguanine DNA methyltransferase
MPIITAHFTAPVGEMIAGVTDAGICLLDFQRRSMLPSIQRRISEGLQLDFEEGAHRWLDALRSELDEYFAGTRREFSLPLLPVGSAFQQKVWGSLQDIPYGKTRSYLQQARAYGDEKAIRAIASANGANGLALLIPCHRVLGADGSLTGYAGGLSAKRWLLNHERKHAGLEQQGALW